VAVERPTPTLEGWHIIYVVELSGQISNLGTGLRSLWARTPRALLPPEPSQVSEPHRSRQFERRLSAAEAVAAARAYQAGAEMHDLAKQYGVHRTNVSRSLHRLGIPMRRQGLKPEHVNEAARLYG
jgi:hypothetical protein